MMVKNKPEVGFFTTLYFIVAIVLALTGCVGSGIGKPAPVPQDPWQVKTERASPPPALSMETSPSSLPWQVRTEAPPPPPREAYLDALETARPSSSSHDLAPGSPPTAFEPSRVAAPTAAPVDGLFLPVPEVPPQGPIRDETLLSPAQAVGEASPALSPSLLFDQAARTFIGGEATLMMPTADFPDTPVTLRMVDVDIAVLLRALCRSVDINIMVGPGVQGAVSLNVVQAPWKDVFMSLLNSHQLTFVQEGSMLRIMTREERMKQLNEERLMRVSEPLLTAVIKVDYADPEEVGANLQAFLRGRLGPEKQPGVETSAVAVDKGTRSLMIQATRSEIDRVLQLVRHLDRPPPQVHLEAHIVEATRDTARDLGIQWGGVYGTGTNQWVTGGNQSTYPPTTLDEGSNFPTTSFPGADFPVVNFPADLTGGGFALGFIAEKIGRGILSVQLSALEKEGRVNIISRPSITTLDNQQAKIQSGRRVPYQSLDEDNKVKVEFQDVDISLEVTPSVIDDNTLRLTIKTSKDELDWVNQVRGNPAIIKKHAETQVVLKDGQTTVIGGMNKDYGIEGIGGVPFLKDVPLLGPLFRGTSRKNEAEELLIFITPRILRHERNQAQ